MNILLHVVAGQLAHLMDPLHSLIWGLKIQTELNMEEITGVDKHNSPFVKD